MAFTVVLLLVVLRIFADPSFLHFSRLMFLGFSNIDVFSFFSKMIYLGFFNIDVCS